MRMCKGPLHGYEVDIDNKVPWGYYRRQGNEGRIISWRVDMGNAALYVCPVPLSTPVAAPRVGHIRASRQGTKWGLAADGYPALLSLSSKKRG